ncbi:AbrB/MazE/SpoVT family DNA-binding domain-containing protein [Rossellomorea marisflavi]|uniref:AbrB/MazE/SpoVT family DNA-binding domain-containing protein n=1 Tax=Rossellomorea marisflavi TaxID=189381 RepID=UPI003F9EC9BB
MNPISVRLPSKNQITVPKTVRNVIGVVENDSLSFVFEDGRVYIEKSKIQTFTHR